MSRTRRKVTTFKELLKQLESEGWKIELKTSGHRKLTSPTGAVVFTSSSPSDYRAIRNVERDLIKYGGWKPQASAKSASPPLKRDQRNG